MKFTVPNLVLASIISLSGIQFSFAEEALSGGSKSGMMMKAGPCREDVEKFCKDVKPGGGAIIRCLKENQDKLSQTCKDHHASMKEYRKEIKEACHEDAKKLCGDKKGKEKMACMKENKDKVSESCKKQWQEMKEERKEKKN